MIARKAFDCLLVKTARERGLVLHEGESFVGAQREGGGLVVRTGRGRYRVKTLVGADGALSRVRRWLLPSRPGWLAPAIQTTVPVDPPYDKEFARQRMLIDFSPLDSGCEGYAWHFPVPRDSGAFMHHGIVNFRLGRSRPEIRLPSLLDRALRVRPPDIRPKNYASHPIRCYTPGTPIAGPHALLVGDAAGIEPALGGGIHMALAYGELAARELVQGFHKRDFSFRHYQETLEGQALGQHIRDFSALAHRLYGGRENPVETAREFFTDRMIRMTMAALMADRAASRP